MNIKEFTEKVCKEIAEILGKEVQYQEVYKLNSTKHYGLMILDSGSNIAPTIYMEQFYDMYVETGNWRKTINQIITTYQSNSISKRLDMEWFKDFDKVQGLIFHKLINFGANIALLEKVPYTKYLDFAIVYCVRCENEEIGDGSILIHNSHLEMWHRTTQDLARLAEENTPNLYPLFATALKNIIQDCTGCSIPDEDAPPAFVMSNKTRLNGAISIRYKGILKAFSNMLKSDIVILPSSVHEVILMPLLGHKGFKEFKDMVYEVNRSQLSKEEFLSDNVYLYRRDTDNIEIV
ncbi:MAG: hypothetical protein K2K63_14610 [Acetatifactor sp.]|nr:hypothetical protein [Acetatifactor sp.]